MKYMLFILVSSSLTVAGCGGPQADYTQLGLVEVSGTVQLDGKPVANAIIDFEDLETGTHSYGLTNESGGYTMQFDSVKSGVMPGEKLVTISTTRKVLGINSDEEGGEQGEESEEVEEPQVELIPEGYRKESNLRVTIDDSTRSVNFELSSDGSTTGPT